MKKVINAFGFILVISIWVFPQSYKEPVITKTIKLTSARDRRLDEAIRKNSECNNAPSARVNKGCYYSKVYLNGDRIPEVIVYDHGSDFCGTGGCDAQVYQLVKGKYKLITYIEPTRDRVVVSEHRTHGWKDIITLVSGGGISPHWAVLKFNGKTYPENPTVDEDAPWLSKRVRATALFGGKH